MAIILVPPWKIRKLFNDGDYWNKTRSGELSEVVQRNKHRQKADANAQLPFCTHSQMIAYVDQHGKKVAIVHQYILPNKSIGGSGRPDPKVLIHQGKRYQAKMP